jgi:hypothetical protein
LACRLDGKLASVTRREHSSAMSAIRDLWLHGNINASTSKYFLATLIESVAAAVLHHLSQQVPHCLYPIHQIVQLCKLSQGQLVPPF